MSEEPLSLDDTKIVIVTPMEQGVTRETAVVTAVATVAVKRRTTSNRNMRVFWRWCTLLASVLALVGGFTAVLVFSHMYVVPHLESEDYVQTDCYIRQIEFYSLHRSCSATDCHSPKCIATSPAYAQSQPNNYELCAKVKVRYYSLEGRLELAVLNPELQTETADSLPSLNSSNTHKCGCGFFDILRQDNKSRDGEFGATDYYHDEPDGQNKLLVVASGKILRAQSKTRCYYRRKNGDHQVSGWRTNRHLVLHAILWPTIIFVVGFVGLFFSCLTLQKEKYSKKKPKACVV